MMISRQIEHSFISCLQSCFVAAFNLGFYLLVLFDNRVNSYRKYAFNMGVKLAVRSSDQWFQMLHEVHSWHCRHM